MLGISLGGAGVLIGVIVAVSYHYEGRPVDSRHEGISNLLSYSGMVAMVLALAAALGELSWAIAAVAVSLGTFSFWAMFWGPRGGLFLALRGIVQLALFGTFFYAVDIHNRNHKVAGPSNQNRDVREHSNPSRSQGLREFNSGHLERAIRLFDEAIRQDPKYADTYYVRGCAYLKLGQTQRAIQDFDEAIRFDLTGEALYYAVRGHAYDDLGQSQRAIEDCDQAIRLNAKCTAAYEYRGLAYAKLGQTQRAISDYDQAIDLSPFYAPYYEDRGKAYQELGRLEQAQRDFSKAAELKAAK